MRPLIPRSCITNFQRGGVTSDRPCDRTLFEISVLFLRCKCRLHVHTPVHLAGTYSLSMSEPINPIATPQALPVTTDEEIYRVCSSFCKWMFPCPRQHHQIADTTHGASVEDLYDMETPRKKRPPVYRIPTSNRNRPKHSVVRSQVMNPEESPLSEPECSLPSLPSISRLYSESQDVSMASGPSTPTLQQQVRIHEVESMTIGEILQQRTWDSTDLLDIDMMSVVSVSTEDLLLE
ncbi:hypothetical protein AX15_006963 [Amanita polypyramis BW_CC]|nr:hypothetical protein AX15_006963 [Amanita polypyramis BW_CC]